MRMQNEINIIVRGRGEDFREAGMASELGFNVIKRTGLP